MANLPLETRYFPRETAAVQWKKVALIGVGLLGGSLGLALQRRRLAREVVGFVRRPASVNECQRLRVVHSATLDLQDAVTRADLVVLCTPIGRMRSLVQAMSPWLARKVLVTDVGSVKGTVVEEVSQLVRAAGGEFVGSHPMAGAEKTGPAAARADLFAGAISVLTPTRESPGWAVRRTEQLWRSVGARVVRLGPEVHDRLVSRSSHLPHLLAATLVNCVLGPGSGRHQKALCANGFRDCTRVASGSPEMWRDIALANRQHLGEAMDSFCAELEEFRRVLDADDAKGVARFFETAKRRRDKWAASARPASPE